MNEKLRQRQPLRIPSTWNEQERSLVMQIERSLEGIYTLLREKCFVEEGSYGPTEDVVGNEGVTIKVPQLIVDKNGHITGIAEHTYTSKDTKYSFSDKNATLEWDTSKVVATVGGTDIRVKLPKRPLLYQVKDYTYAYSNLASGAILSITGTQLGVSTPTGYTPVAVRRAWSGNDNVDVRGFNGNATGSDVVLQLRNVTTSSRSGTARVSILYLMSQ